MISVRDILTMYNERKKNLSPFRGMMGHARYLLSAQLRSGSVVSGLVRKLESMGEQDVPSSAIGELAMEALKGLDPVAYVRFASVYRDFREAADFHEVLAEIAGKAGAAPPETGTPPGATLTAGGKL